MPNLSLPPLLSACKAGVSQIQLAQNGVSSLDAVESAIRVLEDDECLNAGKPMLSIFLLHFGMYKSRDGVEFDFEGNS